MTEAASGIVHEAQVAETDKAMAEAASGMVHQSDVTLFRAVHCIPFARLKDIICTHYGANHFDTEWRRVRQGSASGNRNLYLYLSITNRLDRKEGAIREIMGVYRDITTMASGSKGRVETLASDQTPLLVESVDPCLCDNAKIEAAESVNGPEDSEDLSEYLETFKCNTTRSCCLELGELSCYGWEDYSDEEWEQEGLDCCLVEDDLSCMSAPVQGDVTRDNNVGCKGILEDGTVGTSKVVLDDD